MKLLWTEQAWGDYLHWRRNDPDTLRRINTLIEDIQRIRFAGSANRRRSKFALSGWWSRRITQEHRLVYRVSGKPGAQILEIAHCRYHY